MLFLIATTYICEVDVYLPMYQTVDEVAIPQAEIVCIEEERYLHHTGIHAKIVTSQLTLYPKNLLSTDWNKWRNMRLSRGSTMISSKRSGKKTFSCLPSSRTSVRPFCKWSKNLRAYEKNVYGVSTSPSIVMNWSAVMSDRFVAHITGQFPP